MVRLTQERLSDVLSYLESDLVNCLYLYGDIVRYGLDDPNMTVWFSERDGKINAVVMKYFSGSHIFSKDLDYDLQEIVDKIQEIEPDRISSQSSIIKALRPKFQRDYEVEYGAVFKLDTFRKLQTNIKIERAKPEDAAAIAELMMTDEFWAKTYDKDRFAEELADRMKTGIGRSYIIRDGDRIVAHDGFSLETDRYAVASMAMVHADFRKKFYGPVLESYVINDIKAEGKDLYTMFVDGNRLKCFEKLGNRRLADYGKLFRRKLLEEHIK